MEHYLSQKDYELIWHPFTQAQTADRVIPLIKGNGTMLYDESGHSYLDLISSWWVNLHGHAHTTIAEAIYQQALKLEHSIFAGFTHSPAVQLCNNLTNILPKNLQRFFFSDNGSTAVEVAVKMAYQFWWNQNEKQRTKFISFQDSYHGDTFGSMSLGQSSGFHDPFKELFFSVDTLPFPATWHNDDEVEVKENMALTYLDSYLKKYAEKVAAIVIEPLLQGVGGMRMCRPIFLQKIIDLVREKNILVIFDEVMTGFCRTGTYFALEQVERNPDIICLSKGLTGGFLPLALTITTEQIYTAFLGEHFSKAFAHGHSYTANPLGCAAAIASYELLVQSSTQKAIKNIQDIHRQWLQKLCDVLPNIVKAPRIIGTVMAFNLEKTTNNYNYKKNAWLKKQCLAHGLLIRPLGNTVYILPPYCITAAQLSYAYEQILHILKKLP